MPTDDLERAKRWRRRHLEPGRIKGQKFDPAQPPETAREVLTGEVERRALLIATALPEVVSAPDLERVLGPLRVAIATLPRDAQPKMPGAVWSALLSYVLCDELRFSMDLHREALHTSADVMGIASVFQPDEHQWIEDANDLAADRWGHALAALTTDAEHATD
jgi:hypothetical protein